MPVQSVERKLAAIFAADIAGYSRLMARDELGTLARLKACRAIIDDLITSHRGRIFNTAGDSVVADFASAVVSAQSMPCNGHSGKFSQVIGKYSPGHWQLRRDRHAF